MTDIVERLRSWNKDSYPHNWEAADEIERLRSRLDNWADVNAEAGREIERLQRKNTEMLNVLKACRFLLVQRDQRPDEMRVYTEIVRILARDTLEGK